jgi:hypothetical protein
LGPAEPIEFTEALHLLDELLDLGTHRSHGSKIDRPLPHLRLAQTKIILHLHTQVFPEGGLPVERDGRVDPRGHRSGHDHVGLLQPTRRGKPSGLLSRLLAPQSLLRRLALDRWQSGHTLLLGELLHAQNPPFLQSPPLQHLSLHQSSHHRVLLRGK